VSADRLRDRDPARSGDALQSRRDVDTVAENIVAFDNDIPKVNADTEFNAAIFRDIRVSLANSPLNFDGARHGANHARKFRKYAVARLLNDSALMLCDLVIDDILSNRLECRERASFVRTH